MKITINLTEQESKGIVEYIKETEGKDKPTKQDIQREIEGILQAAFQSQHSALADYINKQSQHSLP